MVVTKHNIKAKIEEKMREISRKPNILKGILLDTRFMYKHSITNRILATMQKENVTLLGTFDEWNEIYRGWIKRGAKGVLLFDRFDVKKHTYYFDYSDIVLDRSNGIPPIIWSAGETDQSIDFLRELFGGGDDIISSITSALSDEFDRTHDTEGYSKDLAVCLGTFSVLARCGFDYSDDERFDFEKYDFTAASIELAAKLSYDAIQKIEKEANKKENEHLFRNIVDRGNKKLYNDIKIMSVKEREERHGTEGYKVGEIGGILNSGFGDGADRGGALEPVERHEGSVYVGSGSGNLQRADDEPETNSAFDRDTEESGRHDGKTYNSNGEERRGYGGTEGIQSDGMGRLDEQHTVESGGDSNQGSDRIEAAGNINTEYITKEAEASFLLPKNMRIPELYAQEGVEFLDKDVYAAYYVPFKNWTWYLTEYDPISKDAFGLVLGDACEWGYFNIGELEAVHAQLIRNSYPKKFRELHNELHSQLTEHEYKSVFNLPESYSNDELKESLKVGDVFRYDDKEWECKSTNGFTLTAVNMDESDAQASLQWVGGIDEYDYEIVSKNETENVIPAINEQRGLIASFSDFEETEVTTKHDANISNFSISGELNLSPGVNGKFRDNIEAIKTLKLIELENRFATYEEQIILSRYVGWGGLDRYFDESKSEYADDRATLRDILSKEEYEAARESVLNSFYTSPVIIGKIYSALSKFGFKKGAVLEPSLGVGHFIGKLPGNIDAKFYGVELDDLTGRIAKKLYPEANIQIKGFEDTTFRDNRFDIVVGNVPFGQYKVFDKAYNMHNFLIHDYFIAKSIDKVRPGGIVAVITSKGTMDKQDNKARKYIAQRADLIGAVRLPNNAFRDAGTKVTTDILFFQKLPEDKTRLHIDEVQPIAPRFPGEFSNMLPYWVESKNEDGVNINPYFQKNEDMIAGTLQVTTSQYGKDIECVLKDGERLEDKLDTIFDSLNAEYVENTELYEEEVEETLPELNADAEYKEQSYFIHNGRVAFMNADGTVSFDLYKGKDEERVRALVDVRDALRLVIEEQLKTDCDVGTLAELQSNLSEKYDYFYNKFGLISSSKNRKVFEEDVSYYLLQSLEVTKDNKLIKKADIFTARTIMPHVEVQSCETVSEALVLSMTERGKVDIGYMAKISSKTKTEVINELRADGSIYLNPENNEYELAAEYLSGNVRKKLNYARSLGNEFVENVRALEKVLPKPLEAGEIDVRLGATWIPASVIKEFIIHTFEPSYWDLRKLSVVYVQSANLWKVSRSGMDKTTANVTFKYGTQRIDAYNILEKMLNLQTINVYDTFYDAEGNKKSVLNQKETALARAKAEVIEEAFRSWVFKEPNRRNKLVDMYNERFNCIRPRTYDGTDITLHNSNSCITLHKHQKDAVARILYGGNTLLAHVVGAGKSFTMAAAAMELKKLGLAKKSMFVVPNHLTEQWGKEFLTLYPSANILVATKKDFESKNRKKFCARIATGNYDAVIIGHGQFLKIPLSPAKQEQYMREEINAVTRAKNDAQKNLYGSERTLSVKAIETQLKRLREKLQSLVNKVDKDNNVFFDELGVDRVFIDESHYFKNLFTPTKMTNIAGVASSESAKSTDLLLKCRYMDDLTAGKGIIFASGTPISNTLTEMYVNLNYLSQKQLKELGLEYFDSWASIFSEVETSIELSPEGTGFRTKSRLARFHNLPELMSVFKEVADIQTADMIDLDVPKCEYHNVVIPASGEQKTIINSLAERAEIIRKKQIDRSKDNMLKVTNDGRLLALEQRAFNPMLPDDPESKINLASRNIFHIWEETKKEQLTQLVFCDLSTPKKDQFNVYDELKAKLIAMGISKDEIAFIHDAKDDKAKDELFEKVRNGEVRILMGSTEKMGAGTNVQDRLVALHHLDVPWRPSDIEQREGRIIRFGNNNEKVHIYKYIKEGTFDSYSWQIIEQKAKFISQIMTSKSPVRSMEDMDDFVLSCAEVKALATGNPMIREKMELDVQVQKLRMLKASYNSNLFELQDRVNVTLPKEIEHNKKNIQMCILDQERYKNYGGGEFEIRIGQNIYDSHKSAGEAIRIAAKKVGTNIDDIQIGEYRGFQLLLSYDLFQNTYVASIKGAMSYSTELGDDDSGNSIRIGNLVKKIEKRIEIYTESLEKAELNLATATQELKNARFERETELCDKIARLKELEQLLSDSGASDEMSDRGILQATTNEAQNDGCELCTLEDEEEI